ncbi:MULTISPECIES: general stress protein [Fictibacillus]|uniref:General stress protein n=1 Tax=Fictibacillus terranigra TaxID=3058424 RepID=A0ABT8EDU1_9BACL|nr:general stress protein [Fictibacillus sp. CENA-BCM004]MDN4076104.1 general stress protein [Fictibacillus sp. CENA-BCM004]
MDQKKVIGVFSTEEEAVSAINSLRERGYDEEDISVIAQDKEERRHIEDETGTKAGEGAAAGAATGGVLGGVGGLLAGVGALAIPGIGPIVAAGPIAATLGGAAIGAGAGGLVGALVGMGVPEEEAEEYQNYVESGKILVLVDADAERREHVYDTFQSNNTLNSRYYDRGLPGEDSGKIY